MEFLKIFLILFMTNAHAQDLTGLSFFKANPNCELGKDYLYLSKEKSQQFEVQRIVKRYKINCPNEKLTGYAISDKIRTHFQSLLIIIKNQKVKWIDTIKFLEPLKYQAPSKWIEIMFQGKKLDKLSADAISGATLTTQSYMRILKKIERLESDK
ncbi:MAG: FMN-binding protein [Bacteriovoracaceae bacterium]|nr:FMN-binding protein [Bacteriovoracaceae bacterium]